MTKRKVYKITFEIEMMLPPGDFPDEMCSNIDHYFSGMAVSKAKSTVKHIKDKRKLPEPPQMCKKCNFCKNKECWYKGSYYGECDGDFDDCFEPKK